MNDIGFIGFNDKLKKHLIKLEPHLLSLSSGQEYETKLKEAIRILRHSTIYWNPVLLIRSIESAKIASNQIFEMSEEAAAMGSSIKVKSPVCPIRY